MLEIEITETNLVDGGVEVFARAWRDGEQIGFGPDGTVDLERFRFFGNIPTLVEDPLGDIVKTYEDRDENNEPILVEKRYREDVEQRFVDEIADTISVKKQIFSAEAIIPGKRGNTSTTYYSDSSGDGHVISSSAVWATVRGSTTGTASAAGANSGSDAPRAILFAGTYYIGRSFLPFNTSSLPDTDTISSATFSLYFNSFAGTVADTLEVVQTSQASPTALASGDYNNLAFTSGGSITYPTATAGYKAITLNATGLTWINKTGWTYLGAISGYDLSNTAPSGYRQGSVDYANGTNAPKLVVEHTGSGFAYSQAVIIT